MSRFILLAIAAMLLTSAPGVLAQDSAYVQIEAQPNMSAAQDRLYDYASALPDVTGFELGRGWYGIALGPYPRADAERVLLRLLSERMIPSDSYVRDAASYGQRVWRDTSSATTVLPIKEPEASDSPANPPVTQETDLETPRSERVSTADELEARQNDTPAVMVDGFYVQIEAQPNLSVAQNRLRDYASALPDVTGF